MKPCIVFRGRAKAEISLAHEMTTERQIEDAVRWATAKHPCTMTEFAAAGEVGVDANAIGRYLLFMEFERPPTDPAGFACEVDAALCRENRLYRKHRTHDVGILPLKVIPLERGTTQRFAEAVGQRGLQNKFPHILDARKRDVLQSLLRDR